MQKQRSASTVAALPPVMPCPPTSGAPRRRTYHSDGLAASGARRVTLAASRHVPRYVFSPPSPVPWRRTLRGAREFFVGSSSGPSRPRRVSRLATAVPGEPAARPEAENDNEAASPLNCGFGGVVLSSTFVPWSPKMSHRSPPKLRLNPVAIEDELDTSNHSQHTNAVAAPKPVLTVAAARSTLRRLFLPVWRLYRFRRQKAEATATVAKYVGSRVHDSRLNRNEEAARVARQVLCGMSLRLRCSVPQLEARVVRIQRAFRRHRQRVEAVVELNVLKMRRDVEKAYWAAAVARREVELSTQEHPSSAVERAVRELLEARAEIQTRFGTVRRHSTLLDATARPTGSTGKSPSYELDVYNYYMVGPLPESLLRYEVTTAVAAHLRRSAARAMLMDDFSLTRARRAAMGDFLRDDATPIQTPVRRGAKSRALLPHFLHADVYERILDNTCYITSMMRNDPMLRAHLRGHEEALESY